MPHEPGSGVILQALTTILNGAVGVWEPARLGQEKEYIIARVTRAMSPTLRRLSVPCLSRITFDMAELSQY